MPIDKSILSIGQFLRAERQEKNIALEKIAIETRVSVDILRAIEKEDYKRLPAEVYIKGFLRAYARAVGIDGDEVVERYMASWETGVESSSEGSEKQRFGQNLWLRLALVIIGFAALIAAALYTMSANDEKTEPLPEPKAQANTKPVPEKSEPLKAVNAPAKADKEAPVKKTLKHMLEVSAVEKTWMKVIIDGGQPKVYQLKPGDALTLEASSDFNLLIGNAGGVKLLFDQKTVAVHGKSGQVATLQLP
jgi:cytoskeleton protein RodZ